MSKEVSRIFNAAIAAPAISAAFELGVLDDLNEGVSLDIAGYCTQHELHLPSVQAMLFALSCFDIVTLNRQTSVAHRGALFADVFLHKGYFLWLVGGYGKLLQDYGYLAQEKNRPADPDDRSFVPRNGRYIALASRDYGTNFVDSHFAHVLQEQPFHAVADLGCGSGARLMKLVSEHPTVLGVGVEIDAGAVEVARNAVQDAELANRIRIVQGDIRTLPPLPEFGAVDVLMCFFMGHDLWPRARCLRVLQGLLEAFPRVQRFLFCDTYRSDALPCAELSTFTLGFEVTHAVMGQYIPSKAEWFSLFKESGWDCTDTHDIEIPFSTIFDLRPLRKLA